ncbi:MAG: orotidine-5'-phosphate decarboxylase [Bacteroidales bacterium]|nr:orotidine-5'-phosphate decarboxylase [Bacteroidales bacterium]
MQYNKLVTQIKKKNSFLCVGLDSDLNKVPVQLQSSDRPIVEFNKAIIDATAEYSVAYKPNIAFYESRGVEGWKDLEATIDYVRNKYPGLFLIADAKRGDIGNTSKMYAETFFNHMDFDAVTVSPYMGSDSIQPFLEYENKYVIILALTSNEGAEDFQYYKDKKNKPLFSKVLETTKEWGTKDNIMYVVGATKASMLVNVREIVPEHFVLVPGVGAQGGTLKDVAEYGMIKDCGLIVNASRSILYADNGKSFAEAARKEAQKMQKEMSIHINNYMLTIA